MGSQLIITAASAGYGPSLLALLGSLTLNWPGHPPVLVYDIGLDDATREALRAHDILVVEVPPFCPHWRLHYTWKLWCWRHAPAEEVFWLDAGVVALQPLEEVFPIIRQLEYFTISSNCLLSENAHEAACRACGVESGFRDGKVTVAAGVVGFHKANPRMRALLDEALRVGLVEEAIKATHPRHRWEQAIISLLLYRDLSPLALMDNLLYGGWLSPAQTPGQKLWVHRRGLHPDSQAHLAAHLTTPGEPYVPQQAIPRARMSLRTLPRQLFVSLPRMIARRFAGKPSMESPAMQGVRD